MPAYYEAGKLYPWYYAARMTREIPSIAKRFPTHHLYGLATLPEILGEGALDSATRLSVTTLSSMYLRNDGHGRFEAVPLPRPAQISPIVSAIPADFDGDGHPDLVVAGNFYELDSTAERADAGVGLFLHGDGLGGFGPVMPQQSGLMLDGRVRRLVGVRADTTAAASTPSGLLVGIAGGRLRWVRIGR